MADCYLYYTMQPDTHDDLILWRYGEHTHSVSLWRDGWHGICVENANAYDYHEIGEQIAPGWKCTPASPQHVENLTEEAWR